MSELPNESGFNQFAGFPTVTPYGAKAKQGMLQRLAPLAGDAAAALNAPRRDGKAAKRGTTADAQAEAAPPMLAPLAQAPQLPPQQVYAAIAQIPGASPLVQQVFGGGA